jgi:hypothetical protein
VAVTSGAGAWFHHIAGRAEAMLTSAYRGPETAFAENVHPVVAEV